MEQKSNEATPLRPLGDRPLNAPSVLADVNKLINQIKNEATWQKSDHNSITVYKSDELRIVLVGMHTDAELKTHTANAYLSVHVLKGSVIFNVEQEEHRLKAGNIITIHPNLLHRVKSVEESFILLTLAMLQKDEDEV